MADDTLTGLTANFTLPSGMTGKIRRFNGRNSFRWKDSEGFSDNGFQTGKITGQGINGAVSGFVKGSALGFGNTFENVSVTLIADTGRQQQITATFTDIEWGAQVGELTTFACNFRSNGIYAAGSV